jgi:hypothetical protein
MSGQFSAVDVKDFSNDARRRLFRARHPIWLVAIALLWTTSIACGQAPSPVGKPATTQSLPKLSADDLGWFMDTATKNEKAEDDRTRATVGQQMLSRLAVLQLDLGDEPDALQIYKVVQLSTWSKHIAARIIIMEEINHGPQASGAMYKTLVLSPADQDLLASMAGARAERGDLKGADAIVHRVSSSSAQCRMLEQILRYQPNKPDLAALVALLPKSGNADPQGDWGAVAEAQAALGETDEAKKIADKLDDLGQGSAYRRMARALADKKDIQGAKEIAAKLSQANDVLDADAAYGFIAIAAAKAGDLDGVRNDVSQMKAMLAVPYTSSLVSYVQASKGDLNAARASADALKRGPLTGAVCLAYGLIAYAQVERGELADARRTLADARTLLEQAPAGQTRADEATALVGAVVDGPDQVKWGGFLWTVDYGRI